LHGAGCLIAWLASACFHPVYDRPACGRHGECPDGLSCNLAAQVCGIAVIADAAVPDAPVVAPDAPPDASSVCYGTVPFQICLAAAPTTALTIDVATSLDTGAGTSSGAVLRCAMTVSGATGYCVVAATAITINAKLIATGTRPLVLLASDSITNTAAIDVSSHRLPVESIGAGADPSVCAAGTLPTTANGNSGGGAGGSFLGLGGKGGSGGSASGGAGGTPAAAVGSVSVIRGGCPGQSGAGVTPGARGHGGGAVFLIAGHKIQIAATITAAGEGGDGGAPSAGGGGGGGAGGMIGFDAPTITVTGSSLILANGGAGGEGASTSTSGAAGADAAALGAAPGGNGNTANGGDGGAGSAGLAGGAGVPGNQGNTAASGGGGGGGGGAGIIKGPSTALGNNVSPTATP
jgi:hypothetical protein